MKQNRKVQSALNVLCFKYRLCVCVCVYTGYWHITVIAYCESLTVKKWLKT